MAARILIISPSWLGDIIMSQSLLKVLKAQDPNNHITVYAPSYAHCILERMDEVDAILENPFAHHEFNLKKRYSEGKKLEQLNFDAAFVLPNSLKSALMPFFAHIKARIGFKGESRYLLLNHMRTDKDAFARMVERYVALAYTDNKAIKSSHDLPAFHYPQLKIEALSPELLTRLGLQAETDRPWLALGCGANYGPAKLWPVEYFAQVSAHFIAQGFSVLALGSKKDHDTIEKIRAALISTYSNQKEQEEALRYFHDLSGQTNLTEALDVVGHCKAAICNDSGLMHTVAAAGVPQVGLFGSTSTTYTPPLSEKAVCLESTQPCHPCFARTCKLNTYQCLKELTPDLAIERLSTLLEGSSPTATGTGAAAPAESGGAATHA